MQVLKRREDIGSRIRQKRFEELYFKVFPGVAAFVSKHNGTLEDAKEVFQEALLVLCEQTERKEDLVRSNEHAYLFGIARHIWFRKFGTAILFDSVPEDGDIVDEVETTICEDKLLELVASAGERCMMLLHAFYYDERPLNVIAGMFGFSSVRSATVQKYKCLEKIRDTVQQKSIEYADFIG